MSKEAREWLGEQENLGTINWYEVMQAYADHCVMVALEKDVALSTAYLWGYSDAKKAERERIVKKLEQYLQLIYTETERGQGVEYGIKEAIRVVDDE